MEDFRADVMTDHLGDLDGRIIIPIIRVEAFRGGRLKLVKRMDYTKGNMGKALKIQHTGRLLQSMDKDDFYKDVDDDD